MEISVGRYERKVREERLCKRCSVFGDEGHVLTECKRCDAEKRVFQSKNLKLALKWRQCTVSIRHCILYHLVSIFPAARQIASCNEINPKIHMFWPCY